MKVETHEQYRNLLDALSVGDIVDAETYESLRAFAKAKKIKTPPPNNEPKPKPTKGTARLQNKGLTCTVDGCDIPR